MESIDLWLGSMGQWNSGQIATDSIMEEEREQAQRYRFEILRERALIGKALLRKILVKYTGGSPLDLQFAHGEKGKPFLPQHPDLCFNLSHSKDMFLCGVTRGTEIGVDIEAIHEMRDGDGVAERCFTKRERGLLEGLAGQECMEMFFRFWTRKEAFIKGTGKGFSQDLLSFDVCKDQVVLVSATDTSVEVDSGWMVRSFSPCPGFGGAVAACGEISRLHVVPLNEETLQAGLAWTNYRADVS